MQPLHSLSAGQRAQGPQCANGGSPTAGAVVAKAGPALVGGLPVEPQGSVLNRQAQRCMSSPPTLAQTLCATGQVSELLSGQQTEAHARPQEPEQLCQVLELLPAGPAAHSLRGGQAASAAVALCELALLVAEVGASPSGPPSPRPQEMPETPPGMQGQVGGGGKAGAGRGRQSPAHQEPVKHRLAGGRGAGEGRGPRGWARPHGPPRLPTARPPPTPPGPCREASGPGGLAKATLSPEQHQPALCLPELDPGLAGRLGVLCLWKWGGGGHTGWGALSPFSRPSDQAGPWPLSGHPCDGGLPAWPSGTASPTGKGSKKHGLALEYPQPPAAGNALEVRGHVPQPMQESRSEAWRGPPWAA